MQKTLIFLALSHFVVANHRLQGSMPLPDIAFAHFFRRQAQTCIEATDTVCPDQQGCCPSGVACTTTTAGIGICEVDCAGGPQCTGALTGFCCAFGEACDYVSTGCTPTTVGGATVGSPPTVSVNSTPSGGGLPAAATSTPGAAATSSTAAVTAAASTFTFSTESVAAPSTTSTFEPITFSTPSASSIEVSTLHTTSSRSGQASGASVVQGSMLMVMLGALSAVLWSL